jgi:RNA ligase
MYGGLFTQAELDREEQAGYVRSNEHPDFYEMWILNYTEKAAYEGRWNNVTLNSRGLIIGPFCDVMARPFPKFFNFGQVGCPEINLDEPAVVTDKMDGSLGILYRGRDGKHYIATRGSFTSDQAIKGTEILRTKYADFKPIPGFTYLFEIIYPENRIVCDYDSLEDLVFLGAVDIEYGYSYDADFAEDFHWPGPVAEVFPYRTMRQALEAKPRAGKEGFVVHLLDSDVRVKIKQADYIRLHKIVTGLNARSVWQAMMDNSVDELIEQVPDEFHDFVRGVEQDIQDKVNDAVHVSVTTFMNIINDCIPVDGTKKDFALIARDYHYSWALFNLWDGKPIAKEWLARYKPAHNFSPIKDSADVS